ncbi:MAG: stage II sporulation protein R [Ruminococcaceae bacterium]|nr:stage II sporulation protein R [Oscillospiraceae bacterium]
MKRFLCFFLLIVIVILCIYAECSFDNIKNGVVRLHVLANSNSQEDQALKLKVRDCILSEANILLEAVDTKSDSLAILQKNTDTLRDAALECINAEGYNYDVTVVIGDYDFPTKTYGSLTLPKGSYDAVRVIIGDGKGDNWWCVLFPPFCLGDAAQSDTTEDKKQDVIVKFKLIEMYNTIKQKLRSLW